MFTFINTAILYGLGLLAIPFIIQFLIKRRKVVLYWGAWKWMKEAYLRRKKVTKINNLLKLLAKVLLLLALLLLLSRPAILTQGGGNKLIIIDNSLSMGTEVSGGNRLFTAKRMVSEFMGKSDGSVTVFSFDGDFNAVAKRNLLGLASVDSAINNIALSFKKGIFSDFVKKIKNIPDFETFDTIYFFSDFQKQQFGDEESIAANLANLGKKHKVIFIPVDKRKNVQNAALLKCYPLAEGIYPGMDNRIGVDIINYSSQSIDSLPITIAINGVKQDRSVVSLGAGEMVTLVLTCRIPDQKVAKVEIEIPPDAFPYDNKLTAVIQPSIPLEILAIIPESLPAGKTFNYDFFFKSALNSFLKMNYTATTPFRSLKMNLDDFDMVVTFGIPLRENGKLKDNILQFLNNKRSFIMFADPAKKDDLNSFGLTLSKEINKQFRVPLCENGSYLAFMKKRLNPSLIHFFKYALIESSTIEPQGRLYLQGEKSPITAKVAYKNSNVIINGFVPYPGFTDIFYNPNYVQFTMRMISDAIGEFNFYQYSGNDIKKLNFKSKVDASSSFQLIVDDDSPEILKAVREGEYLSFSAEPKLKNSFCAILDKEKKIYEFGYNVTRNDSNITCAKKGSFKKAIASGLTFQEDYNSGSVKSVKEYLWIFFFLLVMALIFENYVHFWRKNLNS